MATMVNDTEPYTVNSAAADLLGQQGTDAANSLYAAPNVDPQIASAAVNDLFQSFQGATQADATAQAQGLTAQGDAAEAQQYLLAGGVADQNARLARVSANIQSYQEDRKILKTIGGQTADIAGANLGGASGTTGIFLQRDSAQQGALATALIGVQGEITAGGYEQQGDAARAEADAALAASGAASTLAGQAASTGAALRTNALNNAMSLVDTAGGGGGSGGGRGSGGGGGSGSTSTGYDVSYMAKDGTMQVMHVSPQEAAADSGMLHSGQNAVQITDAGKQAAAMYERDVGRGQPAVATGGGGVRVVQDAGSTNISKSGLG